MILVAIVTTASMLVALKLFKDFANDSRFWSYSRESDVGATRGVYQLANNVDVELNGEINHNPISRNIPSHENVSLDVPTH